ncbi:MAG: winged helix-turn-helix domain-containing protein [Flavobacteriales bacterium]|nr:winged helix-turn-helix domain-containing protein [Flavobacteriales bacterium]MBP6699021.1 winged helix-turn-helix domain-containing protein [Flavobacteriales bacterium]
MAELIRSGNFLFNPATGELIHRDEAGKERITRLQPQPARLLTLLLERHPDIVDRERIKDALWPDVLVDLDASIPFCIRQIRAALNDSAAVPRYIETIPRRGYRWIADVQREQSRAGEGTKENAMSAPVYAEAMVDARPRTNSIAWIKRRWWLAFPAIALLAALVYSASTGWNDAGDATAGADPMRIAIMPFAPADTANAFAGNDIASRLVEALNNAPQNGSEIIGPTTTSTFDPGAIRRSALQFGIDYVINGRFSMTGAESRLLAEVIRVSDGTHVWVMSYDPSTNSPTITEEIQKGLAEEIGKAP